MPARRKIKLWQPEVALLPDIHHYLLLLAGEALKLKSRRRLVRLAVKCESAVVARTIAQDDGPCRIVVPIAHLAIGHAHYLHRDIAPALEHLKLARTHFHTLPDSPLKQLWLGRCVRILVDIHRWGVGLVGDPDVSPDAVGLLRGLMSLMIGQSPHPRGLNNMADNALLRLAYTPGTWYEQCLYDIVEISTDRLRLHERLHRPPESDPHYARLVALLLSTPAKGARASYSVERKFAYYLSVNLKADEALPLWRRLQRWENKHVINDADEEDIRLGIVKCLVTLGRGHDAKAELSKIDLASNLINYPADTGPPLLYLARYTYFHLGEFDTLLDLCRGYQDISDEACKVNDYNPLMNRYFSTRLLKIQGHYEEAIKRYRVFVSIVENTEHLVHGKYLVVGTHSRLMLDLYLIEGQRGLAHALRLSNRVDECIFQYRKVLQSAQTTTFKGISGIRVDLKSLAYLYESTGDTENAIIAYDLLHRKYLRKHVGDPMAMIKYCWYRGKMFLLMGQHEHAMELFRHAYSTCATKRERAKMRWPTPAEVELARRTMESLDEGEQATPGPRGNVVQEQEQEQGDTAAQSTLIEAPSLPPHTTAHSENGSIPSPPTIRVKLMVEPPAVYESLLPPLEGSDRHPYGREVTISRTAARDNDRWWAHTIEASMEVAKRGDTVEDPVPMDHYDSDLEEAELGAGEPRLDTDPFVAEPVGRRRDELTAPTFSALPGTYEEFQEMMKAEKERYPWRKGFF